MRNYLSLISFFLFFFFISSTQKAFAEKQPFIVVLDAGHGGADPGTVGRIAQEKKIALSVVLRLGKLIEKKTDAKVVYTRKKDVFVKLIDRAKIANRANANLFISIHVNALDIKTNSKARTFSGSETFTLGLHRSDDNLAVAKRENSVILLEEDYQTNYANFNPKSSESYIIFEMMQDNFLTQSISFATVVQKKLHTNCKRIDRGVKQAGFCVIRETSMPSVLVELGYITNRNEEKYMSSKKGQKEYANALFDAFVKWKKDYDSTDVIANNGASKPNVISKLHKKIVSSKKNVYKIQILASSTLLKKNSREFKGLKGISMFKDKGWYKYTYGETTDYKKIKKIKQTVVDKKFKDAFIIYNK